MMHSGWELAHENPYEITERMEVPGGWLYRNRAKASDKIVHLVFVPRPPMTKDRV